MINLIFWSISRCWHERRMARRRMRGLYTPWPKQMMLAVALLLASVALWVFAFPTALAEVGDEYTVNTAGDTLNIRSNPWLGAEVIGTLWPGDTVTLISENDGWSLVTASIEEGKGYAKRDYLTLAKADKPLGTYQNASGGRVRVRAEPGGERVRWLEDEATVSVSRWTDNGGERWGFVGDGYVLGRCLEVAP